MPNLGDYARTCAAFSWQEAERELSRLSSGGLNIAYECVDRHADSPRRDQLALRWLSKAAAARDISYGELRRLTNRFANVLRKLGVGKGDRVFALAGRIPELYTTALGALPRVWGIVWVVDEQPIKKERRQANEREKMS